LTKKTKNLLFIGIAIAVVAIVALYLKKKKAKEIPPSEEVEESKWRYQ
jgi:LPXTG-motif cell wall-anchored protein